MKYSLHEYEAEVSETEKVKAAELKPSNQEKFILNMIMDLK